MSKWVCAVVVTYTRKKLLRECLEALKGQTRRVDHILVVDNASADGTEEVLKAEFPEMGVLRLPENQGGAGWGCGARCGSSAPTTLPQMEPLSATTST